MKTTDSDIYLIETFQDYLNYKFVRRKKEEEINNYKSQNEYIITIPESSILSEDEKIDYPINRNSILIKTILAYVEDMTPNEIDEVKTIQLMLMKLTYGKCDDEIYERIMNLDRMIAKKATNKFNFGAGSKNNIYAGGSK